MKFVSTEQSTPPVSFYEALLQGLAPDGGLYVPEQFPRLDHTIIERLKAATLHELGFHLMQAYLPEFSDEQLFTMIVKTLSFPIPLIQLEQHIYLLEVFHGPTLSFKDVGARFLANALTHYMQQQNQHVTVMVATSGDTGSAIANALHHLPNITVYVLYPSKKITFLQEQQMTTLGGNVHAIEVTGTFDDCQRLVKTALLDNDIRARTLLTTANSINIARLLPQIIYHTYGVTQLQQTGIATSPILSVPSGNLGNVTAAIYAQSLGIPIEHFIVANNSNAVFTQYLSSGKFTPHPSEATASNAMDVGNPSNFARILSFYQSNSNAIHKNISSLAIDDRKTLQQIKETHDNTGYILDPHTAVGVAASKAFIQTHPNDTPHIITATAHPAKFPEVVKRALNMDVAMPERLRKVLDKPKHSTTLSPDYQSFKDYLLQ